MNEWTIFVTTSPAPQPGQPVLEDAIQELQVALEELLVAEEELHQQNEELLAARREMEAERQRYQDLFNFAPEGYLVTYLNGKILEANRTAALLLNVPQAFLPDKMFASYIAGECRKDFRSRLTRYSRAAQAHSVGGGGRSEDPYSIEQEWHVLLQPRRSAPLDVAITVTLRREPQGYRLRWSLRDITERLRTEEMLRESEARFHALAESTAAAIWIVQDGAIAYANPAAVQLTGYPLDEQVGLPFLELLHPQDHPFLQSFGFAQPGANLAGQEPKRRELPLVTKSGEDCWGDLTAGYMELRGEPAWLINAYDITQRVHSERERTELLRRLVDAQEEERARISRELHDQMGQNLSALMLTLKSFQTSLQEAGLLAGYAGRLQQLQAIAAELGQEAHSLAVCLRPTALDDLGLPTALANYAEDWSEWHGIEVDYQCGLDNGEDLPIQSANAIYRIVQEALTNVLKHARATRVSLILDQTPGHLLAIVEDNGRGFAVDEVMRPKNSKRRLGLLGMKERAELSGGSLMVESAPGRGTTVFARLPLSPPHEKGSHGTLTNLPG